MTNSTGKIHALTPINGQARPGEKESAIEMLETVLEQAKEGRVAGVAIAVVRPNGACNSSHSETYSAPALLGAVTLLNYRLLRYIEDEPDDPNSDRLG